MIVERGAGGDDFTFPTITDHNSLSQIRFTGISSSPFWFVASSVSESPEGDTFCSRPKACRSRSFSSIEGGKVLTTFHAEVNSGATDGGRCESFLDDEEKMDMLWEDLNDELSCKKEGDTSSGSAESSDKTIASSELELGTKGVGGMEDLCHLRALKMPHSNGMLPHGKTSLLVMLKVLKKLFLLHRSHCPKKTGIIE